MPWPPSKSFTFTGLDHDQVNLTSFFVNLCVAPTYARLQQLFYDLYRDGRYTPEYLFMAAKDIAMLKNEVFEDMPQHPPYSLSALIAESVLSGKFTSRATGHTAHIVPLPDLERGTVIVGFLR